MSQKPRDIGRNIKWQLKEA